MAEFGIACVGAGASFAAGSLLHLIGWTAVNVGILPLIVVAGVMNLALLRRQRSAVRAPAATMIGRPP